MSRLADLAAVLRSKNAGPLHVTFDVLFERRDVFERVACAAALAPARLAALYGVPADQVSVIPYAVVRAIKITLPRRQVSGDLADGDIYGCQQHGPLAGLEIPDAEPRAGRPAASPSAGSS